MLSDTYMSGERRFPNQFRTVATLEEMVQSA
jgi:hypothetical protein